MGDDTISRKATIDAMEGVDWYHINKDGQLTHGANSKEDEPLYKAKDVYAALNKMPSAQPEKRTEERTETHACDLISRQAAIDAHYEYCNKHPDAGFPVWSLKILEDLPSAQPEIIRCCKCGFWDRDTLRHQFNDFRDWNEAECMILAERDPYHEMDRYTEADDFCSHAERRTDE